MQEYSNLTSEFDHQSFNYVSLPGHGVKIQLNEVHDHQQGV